MSFPFGKFDIIMEYGGSYGSSRLSTISPEVSKFPILHFLKMDLENSSAARALCENVETPSHSEIRRVILYLHASILCSILVSCSIGKCHDILLF